MGRRRGGTRRQWRHLWAHRRRLVPRVRARSRVEGGQERVPESKVVKNRVHLGCAVGSLDELDAELERLRALGATLAWEEEFPSEIAARFRNLVLRDPEGNEFCLGAGTPPG
ncbi:MAG: VOC family protein [Acidimicrobiia bacterium]